MSGHFLSHCLSALDISIAWGATFLACFYVLFSLFSVYVFVYLFIAWGATLALGAEVRREYLSTGYGLRFSTEIYGSKREKMVFHEYPSGSLFGLTESPKSPETSGSLRENVI